ncbi:tetratricopeptide repeat protein [Nannocystis exedens]|nr:tetratricopeptide repeat protein [Nannocystis exedens]
MSWTTGTNEQAAAQPTAADLSAQAIERFKARDYDAAVRLFEEAYAIDKVPNYLFNIGRVYEEKGDIRAAVDYYQRFVKEPGVEIEARDLALQRLRVLKGILQETDPAEAKPAPAAPAPAPVAEGPKPEPAPVKPAAPDPKWRTMKLAGAGLLGVGGGALLVGGVLGGLALSKQSQLDATHDFAARQDLKRDGERLALATDVLIIGGAVLALTGVVLVAVGVSKGKSSAVAERRVLPTGTGLVARF